MQRAVGQHGDLGLAHALEGLAVGDLLRVAHEALPIAGGPVRLDAICEEPQADEAADEEHEPHHIHPDSMADGQP